MCIENSVIKCDLYDLLVCLLHIYLCAHNNVNALVLAQFMYFHVRTFSHVSCFNYLSATRFDSGPSDMAFQGGKGQLSPLIFWQEYKHNLLLQMALDLYSSFQIFRPSYDQVWLSRNAERNADLANVAHRDVFWRVSRGTFFSLLNEHLIELCTYSH